MHQKNRKQVALFLSSAPGESIIRATKKNKALKAVLDVANIPQIAGDYYALWHEAETDDEKVALWKEYNEQILLAPLGAFAGRGLFAFGANFAYSHLSPLNSLFFFSGILLSVYMVSRK